MTYKRSQTGSMTTPFGRITFAVEGGALVELAFSDEAVNENDDALLLEVKHAISAYINDGQPIEIPIAFQRGTAFQRDVWKALLTIPFGETRTYKDIASAINRPRAVRAVGQACKANPIGIVVPCHRVVSSDGSVGGYGGILNNPKKAKLLSHEARHRQLSR